MGEDVEEMLQSDLRLELEGAKDLREAIAYADSVHDYVAARYDDRDPCR